MSAWTENGNVAGATIKLTATPTSLVPVFSFGCNPNNTASCSLGTVYSDSTPRQVSARITVPATATSVTSVKLTATASASGLTSNPAVAMAITVNAGTAPSSSASTGSSATSTGNTATNNTTSPLPVGSLPTIAAGSTSSLSPGGNAAGLFPTIDPSAIPNPSPSHGAAGAGANPVANTQALPIGTPVVDAQLVGLGALGVAFLLAATRLSVRKRPAATPAGKSTGTGTPAGDPPSNKPAADEAGPIEPANPASSAPASSTPGEQAGSEPAASEPPESGSTDRPADS